MQSLNHLFTVQTFFARRREFILINPAYPRVPSNGIALIIGESGEAAVHRVSIQDTIASGAAFAHGAPGTTLVSIGTNSFLNPIRDDCSSFDLFIGCILLQGGNLVRGKIQDTIEFSCLNPLPQSR
jgi:hypothetical protein